jgi:hypothetical protein
MKKIANGNIIFVTWDEIEKSKSHLNDEISKKYEDLWRAFRHGLVIVLKKKGRYNLWTQISDAHGWKKLFEGDWDKKLNTLKGWKKEATKILLAEKPNTNL